MKRLIFVSLSILACTACCASIPRLKPTVIETYPHDSRAYTQGLFFYGDTFYESTGQNGSSSIRKVDLKSGRTLASTGLDKKYFGEGAAIVADKLYMLTWTSGTALIFDPSTLKLLKSVSYSREGWGLASLPSAAHGQGSSIPPTAVMVASDGSASLFYLDAGLKCVKTLKVTQEGFPVRMLNELEWVNGKIWANVYLTDDIVIINPDTGLVEMRLDCSELIPLSKRTADMDVLNGIAVDKAGNIYLTGKNWPKLFKVKIR